MHPNFCSIINSLLNTLSINSSTDFYTCIIEFIFSLNGELNIFNLKYNSINRRLWISDLAEFDNEFYDKQINDAKSLKRFLVPINFNNYENSESNLKDKPVLLETPLSIETPSQMECLQNNIT